MLPLFPNANVSGQRGRLPEESFLSQQIDLIAWIHSSSHYEHAHPTVQPVARKQVRSSCRRNQLSLPTEELPVKYRLRGPGCCFHTAAAGKQATAPAKRVPEAEAQTLSMHSAANAKTETQ